jgi:acyl-[acyl-carrier-protein] desaturase
VVPHSSETSSSSTLATCWRELDEAKPRHARALLSADARALAIERGIAGLYRWYTESSQRRRNWHPDTCIDWRQLRSDHSDAVRTIIEGFYAVEQYTPDYVTSVIRMIRESYGRSQWHVRWGAEEAKHADLWRNALSALGHRSEAWIEEYGNALRQSEFRLPWDDHIHVVFYQVIQERATQVSYVNLGLAAQGRLARLKTPADPALARACTLIAIDEAAHYAFFGEVARLLLYYDPEASLQAMVDVLRHFTMPARDIIPGYDTFGRVLHECGVFSRAIHYRDVVKVVLDTLSAPALRQLEEGLRRAREIPASDGSVRTAAFMDCLDYGQIADKVARLFTRTTAHLERSGLGRQCESRFAPAWASEQE